MIISKQRIKIKCELVTELHKPRLLGVIVMVVLGWAQKKATFH